QFPNSYFINKAREFYCEFQYNEEVPVETLENLESFVEKHADNCKIDQVHFSIYSIFRKTQQIKELERYISKYPNQPWVTQAWRAIYELYVGEWDEDKISSFRSLYPNYPFMEELTRDLALLNEELYPIEKDGLYGYINAKGKVVIPFSYEDAGFFNNGIAVVQQNEKFGAINKRNQVIIPFHYETIYDFDQDVAIAGDSSFYGLISKTGEIVVSFKYTEIKKINPVVFVFQDSIGFGFYNVRGIPLKKEVLFTCVLFLEDEELSLFFRCSSIFFLASFPSASRKSCCSNSLALCSGFPELLFETSCDQSSKDFFRLSFTSTITFLTSPPPEFVTSKFSKFNSSSCSFSTTKPSSNLEIFFSALNTSTVVTTAPITSVVNVNAMAR
ncbi:MAG: WG repeat-containing protein, partial [Crocinitomicaceae bacterium]